MEAGQSFEKADFVAGTVDFRGANFASGTVSFVDVQCVPESVVFNSEPRRHHHHATA